MVARDYINRKIDPRKRQSINKSFLTGTVFGLMLGIGIAVGVYYSFQSIELGTLVPKEQVASLGKRKTVPERLPGSDFRFFSHLPSFEITVPDAGQSAASSDKGTKSPAPLYILQAGAFRTQVAADARKQLLSGLDYEANIKKFTRDGHDWFRIWLGPYPLSEASSTRRQLRSKGVETMIKEER